tara:strand:- start:163 stop:924 length:762 start_codon:yes stop_codon:yes gene_type:complete
MIKNRKDYMRNVYALYWHDTRIKYGFINYDRSLISEITKIKQDGKVLEVAIGDGEPYAKEMLSRGYDIYGIDIAPRLIKHVQESLPEIKASVGDAENLEFPDNTFDIAYCFRSTWFFPGLLKAIDEMIRVTKQKGGVIFDLQNKNHSAHRKLEQKRVWANDHYILSLLIIYLKNVIKIMVRPIKYYKIVWSFKQLIYVSPSDVPFIFSVLKNKVSNIKIFGVAWDDDYPLISIDSKDLKKINSYDRIVLKIIK